MAGLLGDSSGCSFGGGSKGNLSDDIRCPVSRGVLTTAVVASPSETVW
jgi:hypothetical protein